MGATAVTVHRDRRDTSLPLLTLIIALVALVVLAARPASGLESDQFTLPPEPLADVGPEVDAYLSEVLDECIADVNEDIEDYLNRLNDTGSSYWKRYFRKQIRKLQAEYRVAKQVRGRTGEGMPITTIEHWLNKHEFQAQPDRYDIGYGDSVYGASVIFKPLLAVAVAPTINAYGVPQGTDKIGHMLQQGYDYLSEFHKAKRKGRSDGEAIDAAVRWGIKMEKTWGGQWWTGAYSNADLASNFAGFMFYLNLTRHVTIAGETLPPILIQRGNLWMRNPEATHLLEPFITEHFDESVNPSWYDGPMRGPLRDAVRDRGPSWVEDRQTDYEAEVARLNAIDRWHGYDYGHGGYDELVTIVNAYFEQLPHADAGRPAKPVKATSTP